MKSFFIRYVLIRYICIFVFGQNQPNVFAPNDGQVKNGVGTTGCRPKGYGSWIDYYKQHAGTVPNCSIYGCTNTNLVGGHVLTRQTGKIYCILAICNGCNSLNGLMRINANRRVVTVTNQVADNTECQWQH